MARNIEIKARARQFDALREREAHARLHEIQHRRFLVHFRDLHGLCVCGLE